MASLRRLKPLPIPGPELARLKETLHPEYGSKLHESSSDDGETQRLLVIRVPRDEPDMVNDVEHAIEYLHPGELADAQACLLVGNGKTLLVPAQPMRDLMAARVQFDRRQCHLLRGQLGPSEHRLFKAPEDPRRLVRLAIRFNRHRVADVEENDLLAAARGLGPKLATPAFREVRSVYLVADKDDVRMDADLFFQDLQARWGEETERHRLAEEIVQKETAKRIQQEAERQAPLASLGPGPRVAMAPLKHRVPAGDWESAAPPGGHPADPGRSAMYAHLDALLGLPQTAVSNAPPPATDAFAPIHSPLAAPPPAVAKSPASPHLAALQTALVASGFDVLAHPGGPHGIDLAAERASGFPARLVAYLPARLGVALADQVLAAAKKLEVDLALVVCSDAEPEARKRFIATRARWVDPAILGDLQI
ncbi:MAG: hypothetical protein LC620_05745 [Halobacteriales archaeon]|nr:hypothetical protein [Halobacteriales archaeon]